MLGAVGTLPDWCGGHSREGSSASCGRGGILQQARCLFSLLARIWRGWGGSNPRLHPGLCPPALLTITLLGRAGGIYFGSLTPNMLGSFVMGALVPPAVLGLQSKKAVSILPSAHPWQANIPLHVGEHGIWECRSDVERRCMPRCVPPSAPVTGCLRRMGEEGGKKDNQGFGSPDLLSPPRLNPSPTHGFACAWDACARPQRR